MKQLKGLEKRSWRVTEMLEQLQLASARLKQTRTTLV